LSFGAVIASLRCVTDTLPSGQVPFSIDAFNDWYDRYRMRYLEPARENAVRALNELFDQQLSERDRVRVEVRPGRIKGRARAWHKLNNKYADHVVVPGDVSKVMDDLVGLRVVCTNTSDMARVRETLGDLEAWSEGTEPVLAIHDLESARDYLGEGKLSGYRAYHLNLCTSVPLATERHLVVCELQLRTLLQDSWGELTHEDTYKPGNHPPPLIRTLSRRMADLMATLDDMAQDLRDELEVLAASATEAMDAVSNGPGTTASSSVALPPFSAADREAATQYLRERALDLERPIDWASLAWEIQTEFGQDIVKGWFGYGTFKELLHATVPEQQIITDQPGYVLPRDFNLDNYSFGSASDAPRSAQLLHETDKTFPLASTEAWNMAYSALANATSTEKIGYDGPAIAALTKAARAITSSSKVLVTRRQLDHIVRMLVASGDLRQDMVADEISELFRSWTRAKASPFCASPAEIRELDLWLGGS
jgi:ppGpp synthetase/RelA/SpoT-type nucleotidyltranferase